MVMYQIQFKDPPTPANAHEFASNAVETVRKMMQTRLNYAPSSIHEVDQIVERLRNEKKVLADVAEMLFGLGCYLGEIFVRNDDGAWVPAAESPMAKVAQGPLVVQLTPERFCNPIDKIYKRFEIGKAESLPFYYRAVTGKPMPDMPVKERKWWSVKIPFWK
jgi:hypothetical protein